MSSFALFLKERKIDFSFFKKSANEDIQLYEWIQNLTCFPNYRSLLTSLGQFFSYLNHLCLHAFPCISVLSLHLVFTFSHSELALRASLSVSTLSSCVGAHGRLLAALSGYSVWTVLSRSLSPLSFLPLPYPLSPLF